MTNRPNKDLSKIAWVAASLAWTVLVCLMGLIHHYMERDEYEEFAKAEARASVTKDMGFRSWAARHGGVYVPPDLKTPPNPFLSNIADRDVVTTSGKRLTLMNPAYMLRQIHEFEGESFGAKGHITSLKPLRPTNAPDAWEDGALRLFESGVREASTVTSIDGQASLRYMIPLFVDPPCMKCHAGQGYRVGQVRGGISVAVPLAPYLSAYDEYIAVTSFTLFVIWVVGMGGIAFVRSRLGKQYGLLAASEEKFAKGFLSAPTPMLITEVEDGTILELNDALLEMTGFRREEVLGHSSSALNLVATEDRRRIIDDLAKDGRVIVDDLAIRGKSGDVLTCRFIGEEITVGREKRLLSTLQDITESKKIEDVLLFLAQSHVSPTGEDFFHQLARYLSDCLGMDFVCIHSQEDGVLSARILALYSDGRFADSTALHPGEKLCEQLCSGAFCCFEKGVREIFPESPLLSAMGAESFLGSALKSSGGKPIGYIAAIGRSPLRRPELATKIIRLASVRAGAELEHRLDEDSLRLSQSSLREAQRLAQLGSWELDLVENRLAWSDEIFKIFDIEKTEFNVTYEAFLNLIHPDDREAVDQAFASSLANRKRCEIRHRLLMPDGRLKFVIERCESTYDQEGNPLRTLGTVQDVTETTELEGRLAQAQKMESVGRLAGGVAHDFNNILGVIIGHAELAMGEIEQSSPLYENLDEILQAALRSADITKQLLAFARKQTIAPKVLDLNDTLESVLKMIRRLIGEDVDLAWNPRPNLWRVRIDPTQVDQILANLATNARDAISGVGRLTIETSNVTLDEEYCESHRGYAPGDYAVLSVSDDGCGIEKTKLSSIFDPFFTTKELGKGTGLGLAMVYGIVKQNGGFISVYSEPGQGTTFRIYLPKIEDSEDEAPDAKIAGRISAGNESILLVEDEKANLKLGRQVLEKLGYRVSATSSPLEAVEMARTPGNRFDLLVTDVVMPEMNGRQLSEKLAELQPGIKCLFMSGYTANVIAHRGVLDEGVDFLQKPFSPSTFGTKVRAVLDA